MGRTRGPLPGVTHYLYPKERIGELRECWRAEQSIIASVELLQRSNCPPRAAVTQSLFNVPSFTFQAVNVQRHGDTELVATVQVVNLTPERITLCGEFESKDTQMLSLGGYLHQIWQTVVPVPAEGLGTPVTFFCWEATAPDKKAEVRFSIRLKEELFSPVGVYCSSWL